jgi:putative salt-induced outer membrane protein YdiY
LPSAPADGSPYHLLTADLAFMGQSGGCGCAPACRRVTSRLRAIVWRLAVAGLLCLGVQARFSLTAAELQRDWESSPSGHTSPMAPLDQGFVSGGNIGPQERLILYTGDELIGRSITIVDGHVHWDPLDGRSMVRIPLSWITRLEPVDLPATQSLSSFGDEPSRLGGSNESSPRGSQTEITADGETSTIADLTEPLSPASDFEPLTSTLTTTAAALPADAAESADSGSSGTAAPFPEDVFAEDRGSLWIQQLPLVSQTHLLIGQASHLYGQVQQTATVWTQQIRFGGQFIDGNAQTDLIDLAAILEQNTPQQMRQFDLGGQWGRNNGRESANRWFANSNFDWPIAEGSQWIFFTTSKNEYNSRANLDYRGTVAAGTGYRFFFEPKKRLIVRFGPAFTVEVFHHPADRRETPDLLAEMELNWPLGKRASIEHRARINPSLNDIELVRISSTSGLLLDLDEKSRWKLRLGLQYTYVSQPNAGRVPSDYVSTVSIVYQRK